MAPPWVRWPYLTNFSFEYYSPNSSFSGAVQAEVKFYQNTGTPVNGYNSPGSTPFYDSGWFSLVAPLSLPGGTTVATIPLTCLNCMTVRRAEPSHL